MIVNNCEISVLIKGRPITEFSHNGQTFIEGRGGSNYEIEFRNLNSFKVEVVLSVDGLSVTDGKTAGTGSSGYIVEPRSTIRVPGWTLDNAQVAKFAFSSHKGKSYAEQSGSPENKGVIGALVFREKSYHPTYWNGGILRNVNIVVSSYNSSSSASGSTNPTLFAAQNAMTPVEQTLGTSFGQASDFRTSNVWFDRGEMLIMMMLYYDDIKGLRARGVPVDTARRRKPRQPQAFPGMTTGCVPPVGWTG